MRPTVSPGAGNFECAFHDESAGGRLDESHDAVLVVEIEMPVRKNDCRRADTGAATFPQHASRLEFDASRQAVIAAVSAVQIIPQQHDTAMMVLKLAAVERIDFFGFDAARRRPPLAVGQ